MKNKKTLVFSLTLMAILIISTITVFLLTNKKDQSIMIGSTTSLQDSGLFDELLPLFEEETGITANIIAVGTGQALQLGRDGEVDLLFIHNKPSEIQFVEEGHGIKRWDVMYNDFVLVGPEDDPLNLKEQAGKDIISAFNLIATGQSQFVSRGDDSGTHKKEKAIWAELNIEPAFKGYISAGKGMGDVLKMADELRAYTLADRATYSKLSEDLDLVVLVEDDSQLLNMYGVVAINPGKNDDINSEGANAFIKWILSEKIQKRIGSYGIDASGKPLFTPSAEAYK